VLYRVLSRRTLPHLVMVLDRRQQVVTDALRDAAAFKEEAEALLQAAEAALASARESARERTDGMARELAEANAGHLRRFDEEMAAHLAQSRQRIEAARSRALADVRAAGVALADEIAGRLVGVRLADASDADARGAGSLERIH
jgi:F0F1-type ATP synthase membrane subunit b/b'